MAEEDDKKIKAKDIVGLKYFDQVGELLQQLHDVGCERDRAGNRVLHMDQYCMLILLYLFNPVVTSLRGLQQASELKKVQKKLGCARSSLGSLSESVAVFDSERLKPIIESLGEKPVPIAADKRLKDVQQTLTLVDGSIVEALPRIAMTSFRENRSSELAGHAVCVASPASRALVKLQVQPRRHSRSNSGPKAARTTTIPLSMTLSNSSAEQYWICPLFHFQVLQPSANCGEEISACIVERT